MKSKNDISIGWEQRQQKPIGVFAVLLIVALFIPIKINIGSLLFTPYRLVILIAIIPCLIDWINGRSGEKRTADFLMIAYVVWAFFATMVNHGPVLIEKAGIFVIEISGSYFIARSQVRSMRAAVQAFKLIWLGVFCIVPFALYENFTNNSLFGNILGPFTNVRILADTRLGLFRAQAAFDHPILLGMFVGLVFAPAYLVLAHGKSLFTRGLFSLVPLIATFSSLSSGAFVGVAIQVGMIGWAIAVRTTRRWKILATILALAYVAVDLLATRTPYLVLISYLSFSSRSAYNRVLIWRFASDDLFRNPVFGIGFREWDRPAWMHSGSTDNFWLVVALNYGIVGFLMFFGAYLATMRYLAIQTYNNPLQLAVRRAYIIAMIGIGVASITVHLWGAVVILFVFLMGLSARCCNIESYSRDVSNLKHEQVRAKSSTLKRLGPKPLIGVGNSRLNEVVVLDDQKEDARSDAQHSNRKHNQQS